MREEGEEVFGRRRRRGFGRRRRGGERRPRRRDPRPGRSSTGVRPPGWRRRPTGARSQPRPRARRVARAQPPSRARRASRGRGYRRRGDEGGSAARDDGARGRGRRRGVRAGGGAIARRARERRRERERENRDATHRARRTVPAPRHEGHPAKRAVPSSPRSPRRHDAPDADIVAHVTSRRVRYETTFHASVSGGVSSRPSSRVPFASSHTTTSQNVLYGK